MRGTCVTGWVEGFLEMIEHVVLFIRGYVT